MFSNISSSGSLKPGFAWLKKRVQNSSRRLRARERADRMESIKLKKYNKENQSVENAGVAFVKGADERNKFFEKINNQ